MKGIGAARTRELASLGREVVAVATIVNATTELGSRWTAGRRAYRRARTAAHHQAGETGDAAVRRAWAERRGSGRDAGLAKPHGRAALTGLRQKGSCWPRSRTRRAPPCNASRPPGPRRAGQRHAGSMRLDAHHLSQRCRGALGARRDPRSRRTRGRMARGRRPLGTAQVVEALHKGDRVASHATTPGPTGSCGGCVAPCRRDPTGASPSSTPCACA